MCHSGTCRAPHSPAPAPASGHSSQDLPRFTLTCCWAPVIGTPGAQPHRVHAHSHKPSVNTSLPGQNQDPPVPPVSEMSLRLRGKEQVPGDRVGAEPELHGAPAVQE